MLNFTANLSVLFTEVAPIDRFRTAKQAGFSAVEIQFPYELTATAIKNQLDENGLKLVMFNVAAHDLLQGGEGLAAVPERRGPFKLAVSEALDYAGLLQPEAINVLPGCCLDHANLGHYLETFTESLLYAAEAFSPLGIKTVFEAINTYDMPGFIIHSGAQMLDVLGQLNHPDVFMQYDIYHMQMMAENPGQFIAEHADKIGHIQFADCPGRGQPGTGLIDFDKLFSDIGASAYSGWIGAEYKPVGTTADSLVWLKGAQSQHPKFALLVNDDA